MVKKIALQIPSATNKYRYTTTNIAKKKIELPSADSIAKLLALRLLMALVV